MRKRMFHNSLGKYNLNLILDLTAWEATVSRTKYSSYPSRTKIRQRLFMVIMGY